MSKANLYRRSNPNRDGTYHYIEAALPSEETIAKTLTFGIETGQYMAATPDLLGAVLAKELCRMLQYDVEEAGT